VEVRVSDNGGGVPPEEVDKLLTPFFTTKESGLGMGLPLVQSIIEQHAGALRFENNAGRGLSVHVTLPVWPGAES
jgi:signal transduction histidine kinase